MRASVLYRGAYFVYVCDMSAREERDHWFSGLRPGGMRELFEHLPNTLYFAKAKDLRIMAGNRAFVERCGCELEEELIGRTDREIFPPALAEKYRADDLEVMDRGEPLLGLVELFPNRVGEPEWFITDKVPLYGSDGEVAGLCGTVRSYEGARAALQPYLDLVPVTDYLKARYQENVSIAALAKRAGMSVRQLERRFQSTFKTTPRHYVIKLRVMAACEMLLNSEDAITEIALQVGFYDHAAFSRQFSRMMGLSPRAYRQRHR